MALRREGLSKAGHGDTEEGTSGVSKGPKDLVGGGRWCRVAGPSAPKLSSCTLSQSWRHFTEDLSLGCIWCWKMDKVILESDEGLG